MWLWDFYVSFKFEITKKKTTKTQNNAQKFPYESCSYNVLPGTRSFPHQLFS